MGWCLMAINKRLDIIACLVVYTSDLTNTQHGITMYQFLKSLNMSAGHFVLFSGKETLDHVKPLINGKQFSNWCI